MIYESEEISLKSKKKPLKDKCKDYRLISLMSWEVRLSGLSSVLHL